MRNKAGRLMGLAAVSFVAAVGACGSSGADNGNLAIYAGHYQVTENFVSQTGGAACGQPPQGITMNEVDFSIDKNQIQAVFKMGWGTLLGQIGNDRSVILSRSLGASESLQFSGSFSEDAFSGLMRDLLAGCTRQFDFSGERVKK